MQINLIWPINSQVVAAGKTNFYCFKASLGKYFEDKRQDCLETLSAVDLSEVDKNLPCSERH